MSGLLSVLETAEGEEITREEQLSIYKEDLLDSLATCELDSSPVVPHDVTLPSRLFFEARFIVDSTKALMQQASDMSDDSTAAVRLAIDHMRHIAPKSVPEDLDLAPPVFPAETRISSAERLMATGSMHEAQSILSSVAEMHEEFEPSLQEAPSTALEACEALAYLGDIACGRRKAAKAEALYKSALEKLAQCETRQYDQKQALMAKLIHCSLLQNEELDDENEIHHNDDVREDDLRGLLCDAGLLLQMPGGVTENELLLTENVAKAQASLGRWVDAEDTVARAVVVAKALHLERDPESAAASIARIAAILGDGGSRARMLEHTEEAVRILREHPSSAAQTVTWIQCCSIASIYMEEKRYEEANRILEEATPALCQVLGETNVSVAFVLRDHAEVCLALGKRQEAKVLFKMAYTAMQANDDCFGEDDLLRVYNGTKLHIELAEL